VFLKLLLFFCASAQAVDLTADFRYRASSSTKNTTGSTLLADFPIGEAWHLRAGGRGYTTLTQVRSLHYMGEAIYSPVSFFSLRARIHHAYRFQEPTSTTNATIGGILGGNIFDFLSIHFETGWYERFGRIDRGLPFPTFFASPRREHDFVMAFTLGVRPVDELLIEAQMATFDDIEVENFNNPFIQTKAEYDWTEVGKFAVFFRYKLLGGFGRWDELIGGISITVPLTPPLDSDS